MVKEININFSDDQAYRYKMPEMEIATEGRGNGIRCSVRNMGDVSKALGRDPKILTAYFGRQLGARYEYDDDRGFATFNGNPSLRDLNRLLKGYIQTFVLCASCGNPETEFKADTDEKRLLMTCASCGHTEDITGIHDFANWLLRIMSGGERVAKARKTEKFQPIKELLPLISGFLNEDEKKRNAEAFAESIAAECEALVEADRINSDEIPALLISQLFKRSAVDDKHFALFSPVFEQVVQTPEQEAVVLYALELFIKKYADTYENTEMVPALMQRAYVYLNVSKETCNMFAGELAEPICPMEYHRSLIDMADMFYAWLAEQESDEESYSEDSYSEEDDEDVE